MSQLEGKVFYSREWVLAKLAQLLDGRTASQTPAVAGLLLVGGPGAGKTALCTELVHPVGVGRQKSLSSRVLAHHFISVHRPESGSVSAFIRRLVDQLAASDMLPGYADKLKDPELAESMEEANLSRDPDEAFKRAVVFPLLEMDAPPHACILVVDSLDEPMSVYWNADPPPEEAEEISQSIAELLANHFHLLPQWLLPVFTMRRQNKAMARLFSGFKKVALDEVRRGSVIRDVQQYILGRLEKESTLRRHLTRETAPALNLLHIKSHGCLLYVETVLDGVGDGSVLLRDIPEIPGTLNGLYLWLCQRLFSRRNWAKVEPMLAIILAARQPPTQEQIRRAALTLDPAMSGTDFRRRMDMLRKLLSTVPGTPGTFMIFHSSFAEWLCDVKHCTQRFLVKAADGHARWAVSLAARGQDITAAESDDLTFHLSRLNLQPPLEAWHLPLWLLWTKTPLPDQAALQVMVTSIGAQQLDTNPDESDGLISPLAEEWLVQRAAETAKVADEIEGAEGAEGAEGIEGTEGAEGAEGTEGAEGIEGTEGAEGAEGTEGAEGSEGAKGAEGAQGAEGAERTEGTEGTEEAQEPAVKDSVDFKDADPSADACADETLPLGSDPVADDGAQSIEPSCDTQSAASLPVDGSTGDPSPPDAESDVPPEQVPSFASGLERRDSYRFKSLNEADDPEQTLFYAVQLGHVAAVKKLTTRYRPLFNLASLRHAVSIAARQGHAQLISILLDAGADPDAADSEGWTPLRAAAWGGHNTTVEILLQRGAQVDASDAEGRTALRAAAWAGHEEVVRTLLAAGAGVDGQDRQGRTPLIAAAYMGHADIVAALLDAGAEVNHADCEGRTALSVAVLSVTCRSPGQSDAPRTRHRAASTGSVRTRRRPSATPANDAQPPAAAEDDGGVETVSILLEYGATVDHQDKEGMTPLLVAAFEGHRAACELLLEAEADVDQADQSGRTPLLAAASMGHARVVELLLFWGCYVDSIDAEGRTVLSVAAAQGSVEVVRRLLDRGLDEAHRDNAGWTPLHYAAFEGHPAVVDLLLEVGSRVDATDNDGRSPLLLAAQEGHVDAVQRLIGAGADVNQKSHDGKTPLRAAALDDHTDVVCVLLQAEEIDVTYKDADGRSTLYLLAIENKLAQVEAILKMGKGNLERDRDYEGRSPLHVAAWQGHTAMVDLLLRYGADVNAVDREQRTPLQSAAWQGHESVVWLLLKNGARVDQPCSQGATPLSIAAQEGHESVAKLLLAGGADPNRADGCGRTALKLALKGGHMKVVQLLESWPVSGSVRNESISSRHSTSAESAPKPLPGDSNGFDSMSRDYSPSSTFETGLRSNASSGKSSSNLTSSTTRSSQMSVADPSIGHSNTSLSFTQQLQQQAGRGSRVRSGQPPLFQPRVLSPLSEPQSPLYSSPPPSSPQKEDFIQMDPVCIEPIWQRPNVKDASVVHVTACHRAERNSSYDGNGLSNGSSHRSSAVGLVRREKSQDSFRCGSLSAGCDPPSVPQRTSSVDADRLNNSLILNNGHPAKVVTEFSPKLLPANRNSATSAQSSHMQIILGPPSKSRRNGFGQRHQSHSSSSHGGGGLSGVLAGIRNSAFLHGSSKLKNALCNAVARPSVINPIKKETQL